MDNVRDVDTACGQWLQRDHKPPGIERGVGAVYADNGRDTLNCRILKNHVAQGLLPFGHGRKGNGLRRFGDTLNNAGILDREETFRYDDVQQHSERQGYHCHQQRCSLMFQNPVEPPGVASR